MGTSCLFKAGQCILKGSRHYHDCVLEMGWGYSHTWLDTSEEASDMTDDEELNWSFNIDQQDLLRKSTL